MTTRIITGDCRAALAELPSESINCCITSPPYWGLRDYGVAGQIGLEKTPDEHLRVLVEVFREVRRVLRPDATLWLNHGDCYGSGTRATRDYSETTKHGYWNNPAINQRIPAPAKQLLMMPARLALALQADGWWLRQDIIWSKTNPMPESVTDRCTKAHEYLFHLSKSAHYYFDAEAIKEDAEYPDGPHAPDAIKSPYGQGFTRRASGGRQRAALKGDDRSVGSDFKDYHEGRTGRFQSYQPVKRNKRSVWTISTAPFPEAHFATFPPDLVEPCVLAGTSERGVCPNCGAQWERVINGRSIAGRPNGDSIRGHSASASRAIGSPQRGKMYSETETVGWHATCSCDAPSPVPATILDPFGGAGTVGLTGCAVTRSSSS